MLQTKPHRSAPLTRYRSLSDFYTAEPSRIHSREVDVGLWWRDSAAGPLHRAAWVQDTGELYLVRLGSPDDGGGSVELLAVVEEFDRLQAVLEGWREQCGAPESLAWLRERVTRLGERVRVAQLKLAATLSAVGAMLAAATLALELG
jgi:hypothetical protein